MIAIQRVPQFGQRFLDRIDRIQIFSRMKRLTLGITLGSFAIGGRKPIYDLPLIELQRDGRVYLTFPDKVNLDAGDSYHIVRPIYLLGDGYFPLGRPRRSVAKVKIVNFAGGGRAQVQVLSGSAIGGVSAEKIAK